LQVLSILASTVDPLGLPSFFLDISVVVAMTDMVNVVVLSETGDVLVELYVNVEVSKVLPRVSSDIGNRLLGLNLSRALLSSLSSIFKMAYVS
jgi:hypothetical protein